MKHDGEALQVNIQHIFQSILSNFKSRVMQETSMSKSAVSIIWWNDEVNFVLTCTEVMHCSTVLAFLLARGGWAGRQQCSVCCVRIQDIRGCTALLSLSTLLWDPHPPPSANTSSQGHPVCWGIGTGHTHRGIWRSFTDISVCTRVNGNVLATKYAITER